ncbi:RNA polymerase II-associated protein 3 [Mortierella sp. NVP85]|nr:RNA polymerase II-associated protein 3 [Mortierella sp. NVP85]
MEAAALQRIAQWEQAHHKGNKKPLMTREYPPIRSGKDIVLEDIKSAPLCSKESRLKELEEGDTSAPKSAHNEPSRKAYYESWDKFDVDQALKDMDNNEGPSGKDHKKNDKKSGKTEAGSASKPPAVDPIAANAEKDKVDLGNELFKKGQYQQAIERYSASMALDPSNPVLPINRAMALLKLGRFTEVERDCTLGLELDNKNVKALWRRGIARRSLGKPDDARKDFETALKIEPNNKAVKEELAKLEQPEQPSPKKSKAPPAPAEKQAVTPASKKQEVAKKHAVAEPSPLPTTTTSNSSTVVSSKRVLIKEVENDEASELFRSKATRTATSPVTTSSSSTVATLTSTSSTKLSEQADSSSTGPISPVQPSASPESSPMKDSNLDVQMAVPTTNLEFQRDWRNFGKSNTLLYRYMKVDISGTQTSQVAFTDVGSV